MSESDAAESSGPVSTTLADAEFAAPARCLNCGDPLLGSFCHICGQRDRRRRLSFWNFLKELLSEVFEADARIWSTLGALLFRPGYLSVDYMDGRRARYLPPLRLYLAASVLFFLVSALLGNNTVHLREGPDEDVSAKLAEIKDELSQEGVEVWESLDESDRHALEQLLARRQGEQDQGATDGTADSRAEGEIAESTGEEDGKNIDIGIDQMDGLPPWLAQLGETLEQRAEEASRNPEAFLEELNDRVPAALFLTLPIFALLTRLLWLGRHRWYMEHLVFSLHLFALGFFVLTVKEVSAAILQAFNGVALDEALDLALLAYLLWYWFVACRQFLGSRILATAWRSAVLLSLYGTVLGVAFLVALLVVLLK